MCEAFCVNGRHGTNISNIKISDILSFVIIPGMFWRYLRRKLVKSKYPINSLEADVFVLK